MLANTIKIEFRRTPPDTWWEVLLTRDTSTLYRVRVDHADLDYEHDPNDCAGLADLIEAHALRVLTEGDATVVGVELPPVEVISWEQEGSYAARRVLEYQSARIAGERTGEVEEVGRAHAAATAAAVWHAHLRAGIAGRELRRLFPSAASLLVDAREWFDNLDMLSLLQVRDEAGNPVDTNDQPEWPTVWQLIARHLLCALENAAPEQCGWRPIDPEMAEDYGRVPDSDLFEVSLVGTELASGSHASVATTPGRRTSDVVQFAKLLAELDAAGAFTPRIVAALADSTDLTPEDIANLLDRARTASLFTPSGPQL